MTTHDFFRKHKDTIYKVELKEDHLYFIKTEVDLTILHEVDLFLLGTFEKLFNIDCIWIKGEEEGELSPILFDYSYLLSDNNTIYVQLEDFYFDGSTGCEIVGFSYADSDKVFPITFIKTADGTSPEHIRL